MLEDARNCGGTSQTWRKNGSHALSHDINDYKCLGFFRCINICLPIGYATSSCSMLWPYGRIIDHAVKVILENFCIWKKRNFSTLRVQISSRGFFKLPTFQGLICLAVFFCVLFLVVLRLSLNPLPRRYIIYWYEIYYIIIEAVLTNCRINISQCVLVSQFGMHIVKPYNTQHPTAFRTYVVLLCLFLVVRTQHLRRIPFCSQCRTYLASSQLESCQFTLCCLVVTRLGQPHCHFHSHRTNVLSATCHDQNDQKKLSCCKTVV